MLNRSELEKWFPDDELLVVPESALPDELSDAPTRRLLSEVGVPESFLDVMELDTEIAERISRVEEVYQQYDEKAPAGVEDLLYLGFAGQPFLTVDGSSGKIFQVHREFGARLLASGLESFLRVLGFVSGEVRKHQRKKKKEVDAGQLLTGALKELRRVDPGALPDAEPAWRALLADVAAAAS